MRIRQARPATHPLIPLLLLLLFAITSGCTIIKQGEVGVKRKLGRIDEVALREGPRAYNPFVVRMIVVPVRTVNQEVRLSLPSKEGLTIDAEISILYRVQPDSVPQLLRETGLGYETELIMPVFRSAAADISAQFLAKDMHSGARSAIEHEIEDRMNSILEPKGIMVENVLMKSISLPAGLTRAIEEKLEAEQDAQRMEFVKESERQEAERRIIEATGERDAQIIAAEGARRMLEIQAEGRANAILTEANAQAEANATLQRSLSKQVLQLRAIEAFEEVGESKGSTVIITDGETPPMLGLPTPR
ncbi:MAG: prohibitin family protein [Myxococcota bacterium]